MPRIVNGLPVDTGAGDTRDSARLAGVMAVAGMSNAPDCTKYLVEYLPGKFLGVRHPNPDPADEIASSWRYFSRDQMICLVAGLKAQGRGAEALGMYNYLKENGNHAQNYIEDDGSKKRFGGDYCLPHVVGAVAIAAGVQKELTIFQKAFMVIDLIGNAVFSPMREQNQLICLAYLTGYLNLYKHLTPSFKAANIKYWYDTTPNEYNRGEPDVAESFNNFVECA